MKGTDGKLCGEMLPWTLNVAASDPDKARNIKLWTSRCFIRNFQLHAEVVDESPY